MKNYRFFIPTKYQKNKDKETKWQDSNENTILFSVGQPMSIDFLDKMPDKQKDLRIICESGIDDLMKVILLEYTKEVEDNEKELRIIDKMIAK